MSEQKHTPGPWTAVPTPFGPIYIFDERDRDVVTVYGGGVESKSKKANARLIAAAPELMDVLKAMVDEIVDYMTLNNLGDPEQKHNIKWARSIIAKAEGRVL